MKKFTLLFAAVALMTACGEDPAPEQPTDPTPPAPEPTCMYSYDNGSTVVSWTGFKHGAKVAVSGKFETFSASGDTPAEEPQLAVQGISYIIDVSSLNSEDPARDKKLVEIFFGTMVNTDSITGTVKSVDGNDVEGKGVVTVKMNDVENDVPFKYTIDEEFNFTMKAEFDINEWNGAEAHAAINKACEEKHTGEGDTEAVTWPTFEFAVSTKLKEKCE